MRLSGAVRGSLLIAGVLAAGGGAGIAMARMRLGSSEFDHGQHRGLFPTCVSCHEGATVAGESMWPSPESCAGCHDGEVEERVEWEPPSALTPTNLKFNHWDHALAVRDSVQCVDCHSEIGAEWLSVQFTLVDKCLACHDVREDHVSAPDSTCSVCHVPLADATRLTLEDVADFPTPRSHEAADFAGAEHGLRAAESEPVAASCGTCHARDFCVTCHVDAPEQGSIQALAADRRSLIHEASVAAPESHSDLRFVYEHGDTASAPSANCVTCHTRESCLECHIARPEVAASLHPRGPGRAEGASITRLPPASHGVSFVDLHGAEATTVSATCAGCHVREDCLDCHRPDAGDASPSYHTADFLVRHPAAALSRETSCSDCHNPRSFCASCHQQAGLVAEGALGSGFHDAKQFFIAGHGQAARQSLESCVSCHTERDCLACHSAVGGRRFNPHGPGFDAERLRERVPQMCTVCHGAFIPEDD